MKLRLICCVLGLLALSCTREPAHLRLISTTDLHGALGPKISSLYSYIANAKAAYKDSLILLDAGDNLQGSPEAYFSCYVHKASISVFARLFNSLDYDALTVGNHDIEAGKEHYENFYSMIDAPVLCANIINKDSKEPVFEPYTVFEKAGYKIAVLGMCGMESLEWIPESQLDNIEFLPILEASKHWIRRIKRNERPDVIIGLFHTASSAEYSESAYTVTQKVSGFSFFCCGHVHKCNIEKAPSPSGDSIFLFNADDRGQHLAIASIDIKDRFFGRPNITVSPEIIEIEERPVNADYENIIAPFLARSEEYFSLPISTISETIYSNDALTGPCAWTSMLHRSYRKMSESIGFVGEKAIDFTIVSPSIRNASLTKGPITLRDVISIYPYENTLSIIEMTGNEIKDYLEYAYSLLLDYPDNPIYVFDTMSGLRYTVDRSKPYGSRITIRSHSNGNRFYSNSYFRVAMNTFRASGGNGHLTKGLGWSQNKIKERTLAVSPQSIRNMLISQFSAEPLDISLLSEWRYTH